MNAAKGQNEPEIKQAYCKENRCSALRFYHSGHDSLYYEVETEMSSAKDTALSVFWWFLVN